MNITFQGFITKIESLVFIAIAFPEFGRNAGAGRRRRASAGRPVRAAGSSRPRDVGTIPAAHHAQRDQSRQAQARGDDQHTPSEVVDQHAERQRRRRLGDARRRAEDAKPVAVILRAENRERQHPPCDGQDPVAGAVADGEEYRCGSSNQAMIAAPMGRGLKFSSIS